jgi:hypothetical protein
LTGLKDAGEPALVQAFLAVSAVEAFDIGVSRVGFGGSENSVGRCFPDKRIDEIELDAVIISPSIKRAPAQFRAVIHDQDIGVSPFTGHAFQHFHDPLARQRKIHLDRRALPGAIVLEVGGAELAAIGQRIAGEVERPALVGRDLAPGALTALTRNLFALGATQPQFRRENSAPRCFLILLNLRDRCARPP